MRKVTVTNLLELNPTIEGACCSSDTPPPLSAEAAEDLSRNLKALADPTRLQLLALIAAHPGREACVCDLTTSVGLSQPTVSHHLKLLVEAGYLTRAKRGTWAYYRLVAEKLDELVPRLRHAIHA